VILPETGGLRTLKLCYLWQITFGSIKNREKQAFWLSYKSRNGAFANVCVKLSHYLRRIEGKFKDNLLVTFNRLSFF
jgi:hypothetical protein